MTLAPLVGAALGAVLGGAGLGLRAVHVPPLVAGTVPAPLVAVGTVAVAALALLAVPGRVWQGPLAVALALGAGLLVERHAVRRLGGITGDVLGALVEIAATLAYLVLSAAP